MTPEAGLFLEKARELLRQAEIVFGSGLPDAAGRAAYLAGFHAAQAWIFERTGKISKTHGGVRTEFNRLGKDDPRFDLEHRAFLGRTYNLKAIADYETGPGAKISQVQATEALAGRRIRGASHGPVGRRTILNEARRGCSGDRDGSAWKRSRWPKYSISAQIV